MRGLWWGGAENALKVPVNAVFRCKAGPRGVVVPQDNWCAFVVEGDRAQLRRVELGARSRFEVAITVGLVEGERAILHPSETIEQGRRVRERGA